MPLVCHENIPGSGYTRGQVITNQAEIDAIMSNPDLRKVFSVPADGTTFAVPPSGRTPIAPPPPVTSSSNDKP